MVMKWQLVYMLNIERLFRNYAQVTSLQIILQVQCIIIQNNSCCEWEKISHLQFTLWMEADENILSRFQECNPVLRKILQDKLFIQDFTFLNWRERASRVSLFFMMIIWRLMNRTILASCRTEWFCSVWNNSSYFFRQTTKNIPAIWNYMYKASTSTCIVGVGI